MRDKKRNVFVLGGGRTGLTAVRDLVAYGLTDRVVIGDVDTSSSRKTNRGLRVK